jgi:hypothetical protein
MKECKLSRKFLQYFFIVYLLIIVILMWVTPLSYSEANILYSTDFTLEKIIVNSIYPFIHNHFLLRVPFFILSIISLYFYIRILDNYFKRWDNFYNLSILVYLLTPGVFLSFIIINYATIPILLTLMFIYAYKKDNIFLEILSLVLLFFTHSAQFVVYVAVAIYSYKDKKWWLLILSILLILFSSLASKYSIGGIPKGHLVQLIGIYAAIFSPLLFIATIYALYKSAISKRRDLLATIAITAFSLSILLSIRQKIKITDFSVFFIIATPLVILQFKNSIEVRLKEFRKGYYFICKIIVLVLLLETSIIILHYPLYILSPDKSWLIDNSIYKVPSIAKSLKNKKFKCKKVISNKEKTLYKYYGIDECQ